MNMADTARLLTERVRSASTQELEQMLASGTCVYGTGALLALLADGSSPGREAKIERIAHHHVTANMRPGREEGVGAMPGTDCDAEGLEVADPMIHHATLSQRVTTRIVTAIARIVESAGEDAQANARSPGGWGLVATDYVHPLPLPVDPEPGTLAVLIDAMGGWNAIENANELARSATVALLLEGAAHGHLRGIKRAKERAVMPQEIGRTLERAMQDGTLCQGFVDAMVAQEPELLVHVLEGDSPERSERDGLRRRIERDVRAPTRHKGGLWGPTLRAAIATAHTEASRRIGHRPVTGKGRAQAAPWLH